jgi:MFS-type transporter involved in bile tolerance (Atg22 family)
VRKTKRKVWPWSLWTVGAMTLAIAITGTVLIAIGLDW